jgi:hypothetical protein
MDFLESWRCRRRAYKSIAAQAEKKQCTFTKSDRAKIIAASI